MNATRHQLWRVLAAALLLMVAAATLGSRAVSADQHTGTPTATWSCGMATPEASPATDGMTGMDMGTPEAGMDMDMSEMPFDQIYIDMMIAHHMGIIGLSQAALERLTDERLIEIAESVIAAQSAEIDELRGYREMFYGDPEPMPMDESMMEMMPQVMPATGMTDDMAFQMDPQAQVNAFCAAQDPDVTYIDLVIPHHQMAITSSQLAVEEADNEEVRAFAQRVIDDQQAEIDELTEIRSDISG